MQVIVPSYMQRLLRLPPDAAGSRATFMHDFHASWSRVLFYGQVSCASRLHASPPPCRLYSLCLSALLHALRWSVGGQAASAELWHLLMHLHRS